MQGSPLLLPRPHGLLPHYKLHPTRQKPPFFFLNQVAKTTPKSHGQEVPCPAAAQEFKSSPCCSSVTLFMTPPTKVYTHQYSGVFCLSAVPVPLSVWAGLARRSKGTIFWLSRRQSKPLPLTSGVKVMPFSLAPSVATAT